MAVPDQGARMVERGAQALVASSSFIATIGSLGIGWPLAPAAVRLVVLVSLALVLASAPRRWAATAAALVLYAVAPDGWGLSASVIAVALIAGHAAAAIAPAALLWLLSLAACQWLSTDGALRRQLMGASNLLSAAYLPLAVVLACAFLVMVAAFRAHAAGRLARSFVCAGTLTVVAGAIATLAWADAFERVSGLHAGHGHDPQPYSSRGFVALGLSGAIGLMELLRTRLSASPNSSIPVARSPLRLAGVVAAALLASMVSARTTIALGAGAPSMTKEVVLHADVGGDVASPSWRNPGLDQNGMFGELPRFVEQEGLAFSTLAHDEFMRKLSSVAAPRIALLLNPTHVWTQPECSSVEEYVERGGTLIVAGDHTDVFGTMTATNPLLARFGMKLEFDSAYPLAEWWSKSLTWPTRFSGVPIESTPTTIGIGATLTATPPATAVVMGRFGLGDAGDAENHLGAMLGNYRIDNGEPVGERTLVAHCRHGAGQVIAYGDTSPWQNMALPQSWRGHVWPLFSGVITGNSQAMRFAWSLGAALLAALALLLLMRAEPSGVKLSIACVFTAFVLANADFRLRKSEVSAALPAKESARAAVICEGSDIGHYSARWNDVGGILASLERSRLLPHILTKWESHSVRQSAMVVLVARRVALTHRQVSDLEAVLARGGRALVLASGDSARAINPWLRLSGVQILPAMSGPTPGRDAQTEELPRFMSPSVIQQEERAEKPHLVPLARIGTDTIAGLVPARGGVIALIADDRFANSVNFEGEWGYWPANLALMRQLLELDPEDVSCPAPLHQ